VEHIEKSNPLLQEVARISEFAIFKVPLELSLYTTFKGGAARLARLKQQYGHIIHFNRVNLLQLLRPHFDVLLESYEIIPNRNFVVEKVQKVPLYFRLHRAFAFLFGGFIVLLAKSRELLSKNEFNR